MFIDRKVSWGLTIFALAACAISPEAPPIPTPTPIPTRVATSAPSSIRPRNIDGFAPLGTDPEDYPGGAIANLSGFNLELNARRLYILQTHLNGGEIRFNFTLLVSPDTFSDSQAETELARYKKYLDTYRGREVRTNIIMTRPITQGVYRFNPPDDLETRYVTLADNLSAAVALGLTPRREPIAIIKDGLFGMSAERSQLLAAAPFLRVRSLDKAMLGRVVVAARG